MRIPRFWTKGSYSDTDRDGRERSFEAFGWSFESLADAKNRAVERAKKAFNSVISRTGRERGGRYDYLDAPLKEEIVETVKVGDYDAAHITRNRYGALVLNTASVMFADVDLPPATPRGFMDAIKFAFSKARREERAREIAEDALKKIKYWLEDNRGHTMRVYRTRAGLRLLFTDKLYDPTSELVKDILKQLNSDALYMKLTERQECFRARLTPKPWRIYSDTPPCSFPFESDSDERKYREWERGYKQDSKKYRVCELFEEFGRASADRTIDTVVKLHDSYTLGEKTAPLA